MFGVPPSDETVYTCEPCPVAPDEKAIRFPSGEIPLSLLHLLMDPSGIFCKAGFAAPIGSFQRSPFEFTNTYFPSGEYVGASII